MSQITSSNQKQFPRGAEWVRVDFHLHTKADKEFKYEGNEDYYNSSYVDALEKAGIGLGIITNHNKFDFAEFKSLRSTARKKNIALLPGVELSVSDGANGIHTLIVFSEAWLENSDDYINSFLTVAFEGKTPTQYENENGRSSLNLLDTIRKLDGYHRDFFLIFAHVEQSSGLWVELDGGRITDLGKNEFFRQRTLGFQKVRTHDGEGKGKPCRVVVKQWLKDWYPSEVEGSDPKAVEQIGKGRHSYLKLGELSFEAVKFALFDHERRLRPILPEARRAALLNQVRFSGGALDGIFVPLSPSLNCLIGPRGNGKSAIIECLRHALDLDFAGGADERYKSGLVDRMLSPAGKVVVEAVDEFGREVRIERERTGHSKVHLDGIYRDISPGSILKDILYFGQKDLSTRSESFDENFLDKLLADRLDSRPQNQAALLEGVRVAARQLKETVEAGEKLADLEKEKNELDAQLQIFMDKGVDKKLADMTLFDGDSQALLACQQVLTELGLSLREALDWDDAEELFPGLKSERSSFILPDVAAARATFDTAKANAQAALQSLHEACTAVGDCLKKLAPIQEEMKLEVAELQKTLNEPQLDLERFRTKRNRLGQLVKLLSAGANRAKAEQIARDLLGAAVNKLHDFWRERFNEREAEVRRLESELPPEIRLKTDFKTKRQAFGEFLKSKLKGSGLQAASYDTIQKAFVDGHELYQGRLELEKHLSENAAVKVRSTLLEHLADFLTFRTPDETVILFNQKPLEDYSLGQRATVILHILMHLQRHPVILIDQPEDDLDNETLYSHFIRQLLERKELTQFIFATHNPNIPVLGDAEQAIVCRKEGESFSFAHGSIDNKEIQQRIVTVMEGGEEAFRRRKEIYQLWKSSN